MNQTNHHSQHSRPVHCRANFVPPLNNKKFTTCTLECISFVSLICAFICFVSDQRSTNHCTNYFQNGPLGRTKSSLGISSRFRFSWTDCSYSHLSSLEVGDVILPLWNGRICMDHLLVTFSSRLSALFFAGRRVLQSAVQGKQLSLLISPKVSFNCFINEVKTGSFIPLNVSSLLFGNTWRFAYFLPSYSLINASVRISKSIQLNFLSASECT